ncbi:MAG TPA: hypothetical protein VLE89_03105, partial [Chlamydiales bacterium]|nr:hypothetical protein [Chlamydiales bacterium]
GGSILIGASQTVSSSMEMNGPVTLTGPGEFTNTGTGAMLFDFTVTGHALSLAAIGGGNITFSGAIDTSATAGTGKKGGDVTIYSSGGTISVANITASGGSTGGSFGGNGGDIILQPSSEYTIAANGNVPVGKLVFLAGGGHLTTTGGTGAALDGEGGTVQLAPQGRAALMNIATITSPSDYTALTLNVNCGTFIMGFNEAMTIFGDVNITAATYANLSDIVSLGTITLTTYHAIDPLQTWTTILVTRPHGTIIHPNGTGYTSQNIHLLANGGVHPNSQVTPDPTANALNVGAIVPPIVQADLISLTDGAILNFDQTTTPIPPCPPCICNSCCAPCPGCNSCCRIPIPSPTGVIVAQLLNAGAGQLQDMLPTSFWPPSHLVRIPKMCLLIEGASPCETSIRKRRK